jgi:hypothetical protein
MPRMGFFFFGSVMAQHQLYVKRSKCIFDQLEVQYLGHIITSKGVGVDPEKVAVMKQ